MNTAQTLLIPFEDFTTLSTPSRIKPQQIPTKSCISTKKVVPLQPINSCIVRMPNSLTSTLTVVLPNRSSVLTALVSSINLDNKEHNNTMNNTIRVVDLFAGVGGIRLGFAQAAKEFGINTECVFS